MLLIQDACLSWGKKERGSPCAGMRAEFPRAFLLEKMPDALCENILVHRLRFWQKGRAFQALQMKKEYHFQCYASALELNITNLSVQFGRGRYTPLFYLWDAPRASGAYFGVRSSEARISTGGPGRPANFLRP